MLLLLGDSQVGRVWRHVCNDREVLRQGSFALVLNESQRVDAIGAINAQVIFSYILSCGAPTYYNVDTKYYVGVILGLRRSTLYL